MDIIFHQNKYSSSTMKANKTKLSDSVSETVKRKHTLSRIYVSYETKCDTEALNPAPPTAHQALSRP